MSNRKEKLKKSLGLTEYPWSSDDEDNLPSNPEAVPSPRRTTDPNPSQPGPAASAPSIPSAVQLFSRKPPTRLERNLFWTLLNNSNRMNSTGPGPRPSTSAYEPIIEHRTNNHIENINHILAIRRNLNRPPNSINPPHPCRQYPERRPCRGMLIRPEKFRMRLLRRFRAGAGAGVDSNGNNLNMASDATTMRSWRSQESNSDDEPDTSIRNASPTNENNNDNAEEQTRDEEEIVDVGANETYEHNEGAESNTTATQDTSNEEQQEASNLPATSSPVLNVAQPTQGEKRKRETQDDNDNIEPESVKEFNQRLLKLLECPVCLEWMEPPMCQCRRGHLVCSRCRARLGACPVCRTAFSSVRNRAMEAVAEVLRYPCRYGCGRDARLRRRAHHEASCAARLYHCPAHPCAGRPPVLLSQLPQHFQSEHLAQLKLGSRHSFSTKVNTEQHEDWMVMALRELFHLRVDVDIRAWGVSVYVAYIGPKINAPKFIYTVTVTGQHNDRKLVYTRATHNDLESSSLNVRRQDCFHLTLDQAINYLRFRNRHCDPDKYLDFEVAIEQRVPQPEDAAATAQPDS